MYCEYIDKDCFNQGKHLKSDLFYRSGNFVFGQSNVERTRIVSEIDMNDDLCTGILTFWGYPLTLLHSERPKFYGVLAFLSAIGLRIDSQAFTL